MSGAENSSNGKPPFDGVCPDGGAILSGRAIVIGCFLNTFPENFRNFNGFLKFVKRFSEKIFSYR
jgi:hypothetical protein